MGPVNTNGINLIEADHETTPALHNKRRANASRTNRPLHRHGVLNAGSRSLPSLQSFGPYHI
jgi:hypothetical protein